MKKLTLITALMMISLAGKLRAQSYVAKQMDKSKTDQTFNANEGLINIKDYVVLKEGRMILELSDLHDYESFRNLDSILVGFRNDIAFYKDSLQANATGHVRIDYVINSEYSFKKIRFKKYNADGNIFMNQDGEISKLKFEQDTVRIVIQKSKPGIARRKNAPCMIPYTIQATFLIGNYYDIDKILADKVLNHIVDTLEKGSQSKRARKNIYSNPISVVYNPYYSGRYGFQRYDWLIDNEYDTYRFKHKSRFVSVNANLGAGLVRNTVTPTGDAGIQYNDYARGEDMDFLRVFVSPYYFFSKNEGGQNVVNYNWFVNVDIGSVYDANMNRWLGKKCSFGIGYLVYQKGGYFTNNTFKVFTDLQVMPRFNIVPEIIFTDNFKQIFPGFTIKLF